MDKHRQEEVDGLLGHLDFPALYRSYVWGDETWEKGFSGVLALEREMAAAARSRTIGPEHVQKITRRIGCTGRLAVTLYIGDAPAYWLMHEPGETARAVGEKLPWLGPTDTGRILRFAVPEVFGALDARLVRVFGCGDPAVQRYPLIDLIAERFAGRWDIPAGQPAWPAEFGAWTGVLHAIARALNREEICCPHPAGFVAARLRCRGIWAAADVEMALSGYASRVIGEGYAPLPAI